MRKLLLTSSQVSLLLTCFIALLLTSLLFASGVAFQHRTTLSLRASLVPTPPPTNSLSTTSDPTPWSRLAHVQAVTEHTSVCAALLVLAALHRSHSPARRMLFFPSSWAADAGVGVGSIADPYLATSRRLLRLAARNYGVELRVIDDGVREGASWLRGKEKSTGALERVLAMPDVDRVLLMRAPGKVLDAAGLDEVLAFAEEGGVIRGCDGSVEGLLVVQGKIDVAGGDEGAMAPLDDTRLAKWPALGVNLTVPIAGLHGIEKQVDFDGKKYLGQGPYLSFRDPLMPQGPDFDVPFDVRVRARPKNRGADELWTRLYGDYSESRREVCGLSLESWYD